jgi:hypothetical protein
MTDLPALTMILTGDEAEKRYCPISMADGSPLHCHASGCLAWRWLSEPISTILIMEIIANVPCHFCLSLNRRLRGSALAACGPLQPS